MATNPAITVIGWIDYDDIEEGFEEAIGGLGGWFTDGMRWKEYSDIYTEEGIPYAEALRAAILDRGLKCTGRQHQNDSRMVPVFSDGTYASFSYRAWGDLMAAVWSEQEGKDYHYMDFYY